MVKRPTLLHVGNLLSASTPLRVENPSMRQPERAIVHVEVPVLQEKTHSMNGQLMGDASKAKKKQIWLCLLPKKKYCANKRFSITSNLRYMHGVLNVDEIKN
jgi:hypothetical protein